MQPIECGNIRLAATVLLLRDVGADMEVFMLKRPGGVDFPDLHVFPGGKVDKGDTGAVDAALREAWEEIALEADLARVLGTLPPHETVTGFRVTPVLAMVSPDFVPKPEPGEVAEVFEAPLSHVLKPANYLVESRRWRGERRYYFTVPWGPYYIWGATARMLRALADRMGHGEY